MSPPIHVPGWSAVHHAVSDGDPVALRLVLAEHAADIDTVDRIGRTPLHLAMAMGPAGQMAAAVLMQTGAALMPVGGIVVVEQRGRIVRNAAAHPHRRGRIAAALWAVELGRPAKPLPGLDPADHTWASAFAARVAGDVSLRVLAVLAAATP